MTPARLLAIRDHLTRNTPAVPAPTTLEMVTVLAMAERWMALARLLADLREVEP